MASAIPVSPLAFLTTTKPGKTKSLRKLPIFTARGCQRHRYVVAMAADQKSESSSSQSILQYVQTVWDKSDRIAIAGLGFAAVVAIWASSNLIGAIDKLPFIPGVLEFIGIAFSWPSMHFPYTSGSHGQLARSLTLRRQTSLVYDPVWFGCWKCFSTAVNQCHLWDSGIDDSHP